MFFPYLSFLPYTLSLTTAFTFPIKFQIAHKMTSQLSGVAGTLSSKNPKLYYLHCKKLSLTYLGKVWY